MGHDQDFDIATFDGFSEVIRLYNGEVELHYADDIHAYWREIDSVRYLVPGVTSCIGMIDKPALVAWAANETVNYIIRDPACGSEFFRENVLEHFSAFRANTFSEAGTCKTVLDSRDLASLLNKARKNFRAISETATDIGHLAHGWLQQRIKAMIRGEHFTAALPEGKAANCVIAALDWMDKHCFRPIACEQVVYSKEFNYSGTMDWEAHIMSCGDFDCCPFSGEVLAVGDFKSSKDIYDEYRIQLAAYQQATQEEYPDKQIGARVVLRLDKEGEGFESLVMTDGFEDDLDAFLGAQQLYLWKKGMQLSRKYTKEDARALKALSAKLKKPLKAAKKVEVRAKLQPIMVEV